MFSAVVFAFHARCATANFSLFPCSRMLPRLLRGIRNGLHITRTPNLPWGNQLPRTLYIGGSLQELLYGYCSVSLHSFVSFVDCTCPQVTKKLPFFFTISDFRLQPNGRDLKQPGRVRGRRREKTS